MATKGIDVTDPTRPLYPDIHVQPVDDVVECIIYNADLFAIESGNGLNIFSDCEAGHSTDTARIAAAQDSLISELRALLAKGKYAIVRGWYPDLQTSWTKESIRAFKGNLDQDVQYQGESTGLFPFQPFSLFTLYRCHTSR